MAAVDHLANARTALDDPGGLPDGELDEYLAEAEAYDRVFADAAPSPLVRYAIDQIDQAIALLRGDGEWTACANCGQTILTTPDDPMPTLICDVCIGATRKAE